MAETKNRGREMVRWASGLNVLAGMWLIAAPFGVAYRPRKEIHR
ncbi:MAG TPA: hypothetical protein VMQ65_03335 [Candidatus Limnocylindria bacterium]|nr:hypothetical protein [Candidatus Limnocylindria bacterium]